MVHAVELRVEVDENLVAKRQALQRAQQRRSPYGQHRPYQPRRRTWYRYRARSPATVIGVGASVVMQVVVSQENVPDARLPT